MSVEESQFATAAEDFLEHVADRVEELLADHLEVDLHGGILTLTLDQGGQYVINQHLPYRQIWLSSPISGASHYDYADGRWLSTRDATARLAEVLAAELNGRFGTALQL